MDDEILQHIQHSDFTYLSNSRVLYKKDHKQDLLIINSPLCYAVIALQGAQIIEFRPHGDNNWLWLSPLTTFQPGQAIRGGIPICLPWFGVNKTDPNKVKHGFVRNQTWQLTALQESDKQTTLNFSFDYDGADPTLFEHAFHCQLQISLGKELQLSIKIKNCDDIESSISWAMHSYFAVEHSAKTLISGLDQTNFLDNTLKLETFPQIGNLVFAGEIDRVFQATSAPQQLHSQQSLSIDGDNCPTCIVWNPGASAAMRIEDIKQHYSEFVCIERGAAFSDSLQLQPGEVFRSTMNIKKPA